MPLKKSVYQWLFVIRSYPNHFEDMYYFISYFIYPSQPHSEADLFISTIYKWRKWGKSVIIFFKMTELRDAARIQTRCCLYSSVHLLSLISETDTCHLLIHPSNASNVTAGPRSMAGAGNTIQVSHRIASHPTTASQCLLEAGTGVRNWSILPARLSAAQQHFPLHHQLESASSLQPCATPHTGQFLQGEAALP